MSAHEALLVGVAGGFGWGALVGFLICAALVHRLLTGEDS